MLSLRLAIREPFDCAGLLGFLRARAIPGVEQMTAGRYARTVRTAAGAGVIELRPRPGQGHVLLRVQSDALSGVDHAVYGARRLLDADADLSGLGLTTGRQRTVRALAQAAATGRLTLDPGADPAETAARLAELPGIGPWTISYILLRAGDPDAFPGTDLGVRRAMERLGCPPAQPARWRPWRGYAAMHLWTWYADGAGQAAGLASARVGGAVASSDRSG